MVKIPSRLEELLPVGVFERVLDSLYRPELSQKVREAVSKVGLKDLNPLGQVQEAWQQARSWLDTLAGGEARVDCQVINATGALFISDFDCAPMISSISLSMAKAGANFIDREYCLRRSARVVRECLGHEHHVWLTDPCAAIGVATRVLSPKGVLVPRSDCVRIPGIGDFFSILSQQGIDVTEVGATNGATKQDWLTALRAETGKAIVTCSLNALPTQRAIHSRGQLLEAADDLGSSVIELMADFSPNQKLRHQFGFPMAGLEGIKSDRTILAPSHFLLGGAPGILCLGSATTCTALRQRAELVGAELGSPAIIANLLALQLACLDDDLERGMVGMLCLNPDNLKNRCQRLATQLTGVGTITGADVIDSLHPLGPSPWDRYTLKNPVIRLQVQGNRDSLVESFRSASPGSPAIILRNGEDSAVVDLRFVNPDDDHRIVLACQSLA